MSYGGFCCCHLPPSPRWGRKHAGLVAARDTLSLTRLLFLVGLGGGRSTCRSAKVGSPGLTTVTSRSSGMPVSCGDTEQPCRCASLSATPQTLGRPSLPLGLSKSWPSVPQAFPSPAHHGDGPRIQEGPALLVPRPFVPHTSLYLTRPGPSSPLLTSATVSRPLCLLEAPGHVLPAGRSLFTPECPGQCRQHY